MVRIMRNRTTIPARTGLDKVQQKTVVRSSKRNRLPALQYQSPESILKISKVLEKAASKPTQNQNGVADSSNANVKAKIVRITVKSAKESVQKSHKTASKAVPKLKQKTVKKPVEAQLKTVKKPPAVATKGRPKALKGLPGATKARPKAFKGLSEATKDYAKGRPKKRKHSDELLESQKSTPTPADVTPKAARKRPTASADPKAAKLDEPVAAPTKAKRRRKAQLDPKPHVTNYEKDPTYETRLEIPPISSLANSRLLIRAVLLKDNKLLKSLLSKKGFLCSVAAPRNLDPEGDTAISYSVKLENLEAFKMLTDGNNDDRMAPAPDVLLQHESTGYNSTRMFGHALRAVSVGRGGKEGNAAFLKDPQALHGVPSRSSLVPMLLTSGISFDVLNKADTILQGIMTECCERVVLALRTGNRELAGRLIQWGNKRGGFGFNQLHEDVLLKTTEPLEPFKSVSVLKKTFTTKFTPLHCAAINPNPRYLAELLDANAEVNCSDKDLWTVLHYAAVCEGDGSLDNVLSQGGAYTNVINKEGDTPLHLACRYGRLANVKRIVAYEKQRQQEVTKIPPEDTTEEAEQKKGKKLKSRVATTSSLIRANKVGLTPLQVAAKYGHLEVIKFLLTEPDMDVNKPTAAAFDKMSPLMLAAANGRFDVVRFLVEERETYGVKLEQVDKRGRTALTHAVMNGNGNIVSYLLRVGMNHLVTDTSGNTLLHYAAAYGWYFNCKLLMEAGCPVGVSNHWKVTPLAVAFMKGHMGLVHVFLETEGADINAPVNAANGRNLLLELCFARQTESSVEKLKFLILEQKADVNVVDYDKNNPLHAIVDSYTRNCMEYQYQISRRAEVREKTRWSIEAVKLLIDSGCDPLALNENDVSPVTLAATHGCFYLLNTVFSTFELSRSQDKTGFNILHNFARSWSLPGLKEICTKMLTDPKNLSIARELAQQTDNGGMTPLLRCFSELQHASLGYADTRERVTWFLTLLMDDLQSDVNATVVQDGVTKWSVIHSAVRANGSQDLLPLVLKRKPNLEVVNENKETPLLEAVLLKKEEAVAELISAGANVKFRNDKWESLLLAYLGSGGSGSFSLAPALMKNGADIFTKDPKTGNSVLHIVASQPAVTSALECVQLLIEKGLSPLEVNKDGRTPLHLAVNSRGGEIDVMYDVEMELIRAEPKALAVKDELGRVPLHYAFVGIFTETTRQMDPIELMTILVRGLKDQLHWEGQDFQDAFGSTPLHYAACVGATICASLLLKEKPHWIDLPDQDSNTPFGLAVLYGHEGSALAMQQMNGKFTIPLNINRQPKLALPTSQASSSTRQIRWKQLILEEEQENKLKANESVITILEEVVRKDWQGILHLMGESLRNSGGGFASLIHAAVKTSRLKLAFKLLKLTMAPKDLVLPRSTLMHTIATYVTGAPEDVVKELLAKGVDVTRGDEFGANPLIQAATKRNYALLRVLLDHLSAAGKEEMTSRADAFGRTLFTALFWGSCADDSFEGDTGAMVKSLRSFEKAESLTYYPIRLSDVPSVRFLRLKVPELNDCESANKFSGLIMSVIAGHYRTVKFLLALDGKNKVDLNLQDGKGRTAIMHAVRLNDIKMVKLLLMQDAYDPEKDNIPWEPSKVRALTEKKAHLFTKRINFNIRDHEGLTAIDHLIRPSQWPFTYTHSDLILELLVAAKAPLEDSLLRRAKSLNFQHLVSTIERLRGKKSEQISTSEEFPDLNPLPPAQPAAPNFFNDAKLMAEKLKSTDHDGLLIKPDSLIGSEAQQYLVVVEGDVPFDCVMTKVDLNYGMFGLYNFYKMQLLVHKTTGMVLLFTRWARVGDDGQYQKTPFGTLEEGKEEFKKIFKAKSGNAWEDLEKFVPMPKKYRLVRKELRSRKKPNEVKIDFKALKKAEEVQPAKVEKEVEALIRHLCLIHEHRGTISGMRMDELPFGLLTPEALKKGEEILLKIEDLIAQRTKLESNPDHSKDEEQAVLEHIVELSEEYYVTIPMYGFQSEKLKPLFSLNDVKEKKRMIQNILHLDFATQVLLAAAYNAERQNPWDYAYSCLNTSIQVLDPEGMEAQIILQAIEKTSSDYGKPRVRNIFRVHRPGERERMDGTGIGNRHLLWHGTRDVNLLSILTKGLQVAPDEAEINGHLFGKGIYFADMFYKSQRYCHGNSYKYIFLCDVALGVVNPVTYDDENEKKKMTKVPAHFDSVKTADSRFEPCPGGAITWKNRTVHLGEQTERVLLKKDSYYGLDYNEYVVFNPEQVSIKYMIQFE